MALPSHPSLCYISTFEPYMPLIVFPPAQAYCSVPYSQRAMHRGDPLKCPKESHLCRLLSDLQSADREFVQNVCCCIGDCGKSKSTLISIATSLHPTTSSASSQTTPAIPMSPNPPTNPPPIPSRSHFPSTSTSTTEPPASSSSSPSPTPPSSTPQTAKNPSPTSPTKPSSSSSTSTSTPAPRPSPPTKSSNVPSRAAPSSRPSHTACASCSYPTPTAACTAIQGYSQYYTGSCRVENPDNPGNIDPQYPPIYSTYPGTLDACDAARSCALRSEGFDADAYTSFDLHYLCSNVSWVCVQYFGANFRGAYFDVRDLDAAVAFGYFSMGNHG